MLKCFYVWNENYFFVLVVIILIKYDFDVFLVDFVFCLFLNELYKNLFFCYDR